MRILLTHHFPLHGPDLTAAPRVAALARGLIAAGHQVRALIVDEQAAGQEPFPVRRVVCGGQGGVADLSFALPRFNIMQPRAPHGFESLTDQQLDAYRDVLRAALDEEIAAFDPHVVHCQHIWMFGHLALESGVPFVLTAHGIELEYYDRDARYQRLMQEAAENAGRILCTPEPLRQWLEQLLGDLDGRAVTMPVAVESADYIPWLTAIYAAVYTERFGHPPD